MPNEKLIEYSELDAKVTYELSKLLPLRPEEDRWGWSGAMPSPGHEHEDGGYRRRSR